MRAILIGQWAGISVFFGWSIASLLMLLKHSGAARWVWASELEGGMKEAEMRVTVSA